MTFVLYSGPRAKHPIRLAMLTVLGGLLSSCIAFYLTKLTVFLSTGYSLKTGFWILAGLGAVPTVKLLFGEFRAGRLRTPLDYLWACSVWPMLYSLLLGVPTALYNVLVCLLPNTYGQRTVSVFATIATFAAFVFIVRLAVRYAHQIQLVVRGSPLGTIISVAASIHSTRRAVSSTKGEIK